MSERTAALRAQMTPEEKAHFVAGVDMWHTGLIERLGIPALKVTDGPNGARGDGLLGTGTPTACIPSGAALGATWDPDLVQELGSLLGEESRMKSSHVLLAPTINLHRSPKGGRNFECYSEDPLLSGKIAAGFIRGVQSHGVAVTAKHFVGNDSEFERNTIDSQMDERTLREVALLPFEIAVKEGSAWGIMTAYNRLNGVYCSEDPWLLDTVLRKEWGFDGFVVTEAGFEAANHGVQIFGGHGFIREWGMEQIVRDARIAMLYEGTTGIQALDLLGRKVLGSGGKLLTAFTDQVGDFIAAHDDDAVVEEEEAVQEAVLAVLSEYSLHAAAKAGKPLARAGVVGRLGDLGAIDSDGGGEH